MFEPVRGKDFSRKSNDKNDHPNKNTKESKITRKPTLSVKRIVTNKTETHIVRPYVFADAEHFNNVRLPNVDVGVSEKITV